MRSWKVLLRAATVAVAGSLALMNPAPAQQTVSGMKVQIVEAGSDGKLASTFKEIKKGSWGEFPATSTSNNPQFTFQEVSRDQNVIVLYDKKRDLNLVFDLAGGAVAYSMGQTGDLQVIYQILKAKPAPNNASLVASTIGSDIDQFINTLDFDSKASLARSSSGKPVDTSDADGIPRRAEASGRVIITTKTARYIGGPVDQYTLLNPAADVIYPGSIVLADKNLADGNPSPVTAKKAPLTISIDLPGASSLSRTVDNPSKSSVSAAINAILADYFAEQGDTAQAASSTMLFSRVYSKEQAAAALNLAAEWAKGEASAKLETSSDAENEVVVALFRQKYFTVSIDTPESPSSVFASDVPVEKLQSQIDDDHPPGYISSTDYGRVVMVRMETTKTNSTASAVAAFETRFAANGKANAEANAQYKKLLDSSTFTAMVLGGAASSAAKFSGNVDQLQDFIQRGAVFNKKNPGAPISYAVRYLKDNTIAAVDLATKYVQTETRSAMNGFLDIYNGCACTIKYEYGYKLEDGKGFRFVGRDDIRVAGGRYAEIPGDASEIRVNIFRYETFGSVQTEYSVPGLESTATGAPTKCISTSGTFFAKSADVKDGRC
jgi:thiol-activated cytolysin